MTPSYSIETLWRRQVLGINLCVPETVSLNTSTTLFSEIGWFWKVETDFKSSFKSSFQPSPIQIHPILTVQHLLYIFYI